MTKSPPAVVVGNQRPRVELLPKSAYSDSGDDAVDLCRDVAGFDLDDWQEYVLRSMLGERLDYKWSASTVGLIVPRQQGKSAILEARCLAGLFLFGERMIYTAKLLDTANDIYRRVLGWIYGAPDLSAQVAHVLQNNNGSKITLESGAFLEIGARTAHQGRGKTFDCVIYDEAYGLEQQHLGALTMTTSASDNSQEIWASSAGMPDSFELAKLRERGMDKKSRSLAYFEWSAEDDADPDDIDALVTANPGLGIRLSLEKVAEQRASLDDEIFKRERLGIWAKIGGDSAIPDAEWQACLDTEAQPGSFAAFSVDIPPDRSSASVGMVSANGDRLYTAVIERRTGTSWVPSYLKELQGAWGSNAAPVVIDAGGATGALMPEFQKSRVRTLPVNMREYGQACANIYDAILGRRLVHIGEESLDQAVKDATTKPMGDTLWKWNRKDAVSDISPLVAVTLAFHGWTARGERLERAKANREARGGSGGRPIQSGRTRSGGRTRSNAMTR